MFRGFVAACIVAGAMATAAQAQDDTVYIQIEARSSLAVAQDNVRGYAAQLPDVNGFALGGGWYGVALGPYSRDEAAALLSQLRASGRIPPDSYIESAATYGQQFWPIGGATMQVPRAPEPGTQALVAPQPEPPAIVAPVVDETPRQARASEGLLNRDERAALQVALRWAGFYDSAIDAAFGPGTRNAMAAWQQANGFEVTGILTTMQRADLLRQYNAPLESVGMAAYRDPRTGIAMQLPLGTVRFDRFEAPFALFQPTGAVEGARVLLISQPGDRQTMAGLYEIMQTLEIVPLQGERRRDRDSFVLTGANERFVSHTEVSLVGNEIKGWTLIWPTGDEERRTRVLSVMRDSFQRIGGVLDPAAVTDDGQRIDLVAGLRVRSPLRTASGFFVDRSGAVLTSAAAVEGCGRVTLDGVHETRIAARDAALGLAILRPTEALAPRGVASFAQTDPRLQSDVAVAGYSFGGVLAAPTLTFGTLEDLQGLGGEADLKRLALAALPGDAGGPVLDAGGGVVGMLLPRDEDATRRLPDEVSFAAKAERIVGFLAQNGVRSASGQSVGVMAPEDLTALASDMTVLVSCWE
ncbi:trypsin-like peptidase domain-containing protein [Thetidibacter halocola]|uniref:Trypsin-like peptidase domain-containing protein n=1 Tax=Thetidibacter halocola TaxID=2827239 RepID=A0A8J7WGA0_9RHOB|nr:trypsin-like peptidase domain-containing protein [Thetidibacter halocola]MBS0124543.1 trypsin-like peptidase domain-containing protein [Thetidibacter halocola]